MNRSTAQLENIIWSDDSYCFDLNTSSNVQSIDINTDKPIAIYNLQGMKVGEATGKTIETILRQLTKGVYIINGKKITN